MFDNSLPAYKHSDTEPRFFYGYIVVAASLLIMLLAYCARLSFGVFFKPMLSEFGWSRAFTSGAYMLSMLLQAGMTIVMGKLNDKFGPRIVMTLCGLFLGLGYLLMSLTSGSWHFYMFYGVMVGIGMSGNFVALLSTVARWFVEKRGMMTGIVLAGLGIGTLIGPPISNWLITIYDWRKSYLVMGGVVLVISVLAAQFLKRDPANMGLLSYGAHKAQKVKPASGDEGLSFKEAICTRQLWMVVLVYLSLGYCVYTINVHLVPHITDLGISTGTAAGVLAVTGAVTVVGGIILGGAADRIGSIWVTTISFIIIAATLFWLAPITAVWMFFLFAVIYGIGSGGSAPMESTVLAELFGMRAHGAILGLVSCGFTIGGAIGPFMAGYIFDVTGSYEVSFLVCGACGVVGFILAAMLRPVKRRGIEI